MAELKTKPNAKSVDKFIQEIADEKTRQDCLALCDVMQRVTKSQPKMWGASIVGFGSYHYKYPTGTEGDWFLTGFSPRKQNLTLYIMSGFQEHGELLQKLGRHTLGKSCLYVRTVDDLHMPTLKKLIQQSVASIHKTVQSSRAASPTSGTARTRAGTPSPRSRARQPRTRTTTRK